MTAAIPEQTSRVKSLFAAATLEEVNGRMALLRPDSERLWGRMSAAQMLAHNAAAMEMAVGITFPSRRFVARRQSSQRGSRSAAIRRPTKA
jgi:hypothetical protein